MGYQGSLEQSNIVLLHSFFVQISFLVATSSEDFDVTLMICILRNLNFVQPPPNGWDKLPPVGDNSLGANLTRIKEHRNTFCHSSKTKINDKKFQKLWSSLTHVSFYKFKLNSLK